MNIPVGNQESLPKVLDIYGVKMPDTYTGSEQIRLKLQKCSGVDYPELLELFLEKIPPIIELELPPLDLNDVRFPKLLQKYGKNLQHLRIEHAEKPQIHTVRKKSSTFPNEKKAIIEDYPNQNEIKAVDNLKEIGLHCPHLRTMTFVKIKFHTSLWLTKPADWNSNYANIWKGILSPLSNQLERMEFKNDPLDYENMLSFFEMMKFPSLKCVVLETLRYKQHTIEAIKQNNPALEMVITNCRDVTKKVIGV